MRKPTHLLTAASLAVIGLSIGSAANSQPPRTDVLGAPRVTQAQNVRRTTINIPRSKSANIDFPTDMRIGGTADARIADVRMVTPNQATIIGSGYGQTDAQFYDANGRLYMVADIRVEQDVHALEDSLARVLPGSRVEVQAVNDSIILSGPVANAAEADRAVRVASSYVANPTQVKNLLTITGVEQVTLKVQVVEVNRSVMKQLGFDTNFILGQLGAPQWVIGNTPGYAVNGGFQGGLNAGYRVDTTKQPVLEVERLVLIPGVGNDPITGLPIPDRYELRTYDEVRPDNLLSTPQDSIGSDGLNQGRALIQAFERQGLVRTLAEPNLTAVSGEAARFLAGGEFPVPAGRDQQGNIAVEFKPFGVGLGFTPVVLSEGRISMKISAEVSELSTQGALTVSGVGGAGSSTIIPALTVRRVDNTVELPSGGYLMMAGLLQEQTRQNIDKVPGIGDIPVLGPLARSRDYITNQTELVVIVSAYLTKPTSKDQLQTPADGLRIASDPETILLGKLNSAYDAPPEANTGRTFQGPFGHVID